MEKTYCDKQAAHENAVLRAKEGCLSGADVEKMCGVFRVLADPTRMKIVLALMNGAMCVYHLTEVVGGTISGVSHQLRVLRGHNLVKTERLGKNVEYALADEHILEIVQMGIRHLACSPYAQSAKEE